MTGDFVFHTFGCKVNSYDTGLLEQRLGAATDVGRVHVLNTCAVTAEATREAVRLAKRIKAREPSSWVVVTGCAAQVDTEQFADLPAVDLVVANSHKHQIRDLIAQRVRGLSNERVHKSNIFRVDDLGGGGGTRKSGSRSFLKIQDGCDSFCSFCIIPFARGRSRSLSVENLVERVRELHEVQGYNEVVLTGVHIGDYRGEKGEKLAQLLRQILAQTQIPRLRLSSLEPVELSEDLLEQFEDPRVCPHFHMSIQSAQTDVLRRMKRNYTALDVETSLQEISKRFPDAFVGMDVIAGFTGETDSEFLETVDRLSGLPWTRLHVFPYSERAGTRAAREPDQVPLSTRTQRAAVLRQLSDLRLEAHAQRQVGARKKALLLEKSTRPMGLTRDFWHVELPSWKGRTGYGGEVDVIITGLSASARSSQNGALLGQVVPVPIRAAPLEGSYPVSL